MTDSHLYQQLGRAGITGRPVFEVTTSQSWTDSQIASIKSIRGDRSTFGGLTPSVCTVNVQHEIAAAYDQALTVNLSDAAADQLGTLTGQDPAAIKHRWTGRIGKQSITDPSPDAQQRSSTIEAAQWAAQASLAGATGKATTANPGLDQLYRSAWSAAKLPGTLTVDTTAYVVATPNIGKAIGIDDVFGKWSADLGCWWTTDRAGNVRARSTNALLNSATAWRATSPHPITRARALSPASWEQPATSPGRVVYTRWSPTDHETKFTVTVTVYNDQTGTTRPLRAEDMDVTHVYNDQPDSSSELVWSMNARANRAAGLWWSVPEVTVDILALLTSERSSDRALAGQLLAMEHLDPVALTTDWPQQVAGVMFATDITETITPDQWRMTLGLQRVEYLTGQHTSDIYVPGITWQTAYPSAVTWDQVTNTWDDDNPTWTP